MKLISHTRVQVTVEISGSSYGEDWTIKALIKQSGEEGVQALKNILRDKGVKIIGEPKVTLHSYSEETK